MKRIIALFCCFCLITACNNNTVDKPANLIERDKMIDILHDISLLETIKNQNINGGVSTKVSNEYIYRKYKVDSIQLAKSNKYYASDIDAYKKMFQEVKARLAQETADTEKQMKSKGQQVPVSPTSNPDTPQVQ